MRLVQCRDNEISVSLDQLIHLSEYLINLIAQQQWVEVEIADRQRHELAIKIFHAAHHDALMQQADSLQRIGELNDQILHVIQSMTKENTIHHYLSSQKIKSCQIYKQTAHQTP